MHPKTVARRATLKVLVALEARDWNLAQALNEFLPSVSPETRGFARELASGVLRHRGCIDWTLWPFLKKPNEQLYRGKLDPPVRAALRLAAYERAWLRTPAPAVVNEYAGLMRGEGLTSATGFVNAIARRLPDEPRAAPDHNSDSVRYLSTLYSHPSLFTERWLARFGFEECEALLQANNSIAPLSLRVNMLQITRDEVLAALQARGLKARAGVLSPDAVLVENAGDPTSWPEWEAGKIIAQDEAAQMVARFAAPQPGQTVIDCAAAPGGKSTHLAQLMGDQGKVIACDVSEGRLKLVRENAARLKIKSIETRAANARVLASVLAPADLVLLDAPCFGTGTLRRRPDAKWNRTATQLVELVALQRELLNAVAPLVKSGGVLVYSTCSIEPEEDEEQVENFLREHVGWQLDGTMSTLPHRDGCDGAFAARLRRTDHCHERSQNHRAD
jgi:16S rRNA (cytosine967-C5)-methyltransferase